MFKKIVNKMFNNNEIDHEEVAKNLVILEALCAFKNELVLDDVTDTDKLHNVELAIHDVWTKLPLNA